MADETPRLYGDLADWWTLLSAPEEYAEEAEFYRQTMIDAAGGPVRTVLELGSGGGNNASHLKAHFEMTLIDRSAAMQRQSQKLNPRLEHVLGDMRDVRLNREFDAVFVHDAVSYITTLEDLARVIETVRVHCRAGGVAVFCPDFVHETYRPATRHGGHDGDDGRALRYIEWDRPISPDATTYVSDMVYALAEGEQVRAVHDRHVCGLFPEADWLRLLTEAGFRASRIVMDLDEEFEAGWWIFVGVKEP